MSDQHPTEAARPSADPRRPEPAGPPPWRVFHGTGEAGRPPLPQPPPWRTFATGTADGRDADTAPAPERGARYVFRDETHIDVVNAAIHLRRPLLVTGAPGTGKSTLAYAVARELGLGDVLRWSVNSRSTLQSALYHYDAIGRLHERGLPGGDQDAPSDAGIGRFVRLGPLGTALVPADRPRMLLVDELDKGDLDLANDLLTVFEEGCFDIPELARIADTVPVVQVRTGDRGGSATVTDGTVQCTEFPVVVITSNGEQDFPPAFLRRCIPLDLPQPDGDRLREIVRAHLPGADLAETERLISEFLSLRNGQDLATDQILNAVHLRTGGADLDGRDLLRTVFHPLNGTG
ncbi:AAA family ATPase [Kitasatospora sp. NPDC056184]|uniref:AAA family ATPase n=1 Tax=Kitasatospora sp. NPDC056184 TaxID=3345738 RepID=UPI0035DD0917